MLRILLNLFFIIVLSKCLIAFNRDTNAINFSKYISIQELKYHLNVLASDSFEGRGTGEKGQYLAADYIRNHFIQNGLIGPINDTGYFQNFYVNKTFEPDLKLTINDKIVNRNDYILFNPSKYILPTRVNVKKNYDIVSFLEIGQKNKNQSIYFSFLSDSIDILINKYIDIIHNCEIYNINLLFIKLPNIDIYKLMFQLKNKIKEHDITYNFPIVFIKEYYFTKKIKNVTLTINPVREYSKTQNVLGFIKGISDETIVISSHYDHLGKKEGIIYYGADDNASGTSALLTIATAFSKAVKSGYTPKRNILFITFSAEEIGLLGSKYYVDSNAVIPIKNIITNINIDMVGRIDYVYNNTKNYVYVIGSNKLSSLLHDVNEFVNTTYENLILDYQYNSDKDPNKFFYRSDHYNFAKFNIPIIFFFSGIHSDYHKPTDTFDKIDYKLLQKRTRHIFYLTWHISNMDESIYPDNIKRK